MEVLRPNATESSSIKAQQEVDKTALMLPIFDPENIEDGKKQLLRNVAIRQGQSKFRESLLEAYQGRCAITRTAIPAILQAAHIIPYDGKKTNNVPNGLLLRSDIHNLFDLGILRINPDSMQIEISEELSDSDYAKLNKRELYQPNKHSHKPSVSALQFRYSLIY